MPRVPAFRFAFCLFLLLMAALSLSQPTFATGRLAIIIDDIGYNLALGKRTVDLDGDFTLAVLPFTPHGVELAERAHQRGKEIMLHVPMSNRHNYPLGRGGLVSGMQHGEFLKVLRQNLANVPHVKGVNNHMGSQLTEQVEPMRWLMEELQKQQLYFVDSRTTVETQALIMAEKIHLPSRRRDVFLDDERTRRNIKYQLKRALTLAQKQGAAIAIGHPYPETLAELEQLQPLLDRYDVRLVRASQLMIKTPRLLAKRNIHHKNYICPAPPMGLWPRTWAPIDPFAVEELLGAMNIIHRNVKK